MPNIAIVWDFDGTLTPDDSTIKTVDVVEGVDGKGQEFFSMIKSLRGDQELPKWEHVLAMDAPIWMFSLSRMAAKKKIPLNSEFFREFVLPHIQLFPKVLEFLTAIKNIQKQTEFLDLELEIHHFIVSAGLKDLIQQVFPDRLVTHTFGCRYSVAVDEDQPQAILNVPVFCMDETVKTRSLFEISKGAFRNPDVRVNTRVVSSDLWAPFENIIYVGDGDTDVPALSLTRSKGGLGIAVYNPQKSKQSIQERFRNMRLDKRADLITEANFSEDSELFQYIYNRCIQIRQRYEASKVIAV